MFDEDCYRCLAELVDWRFALIDKKNDGWLNNPRNPSLTLGLTKLRDGIIGSVIWVVAR